MPATEKTERKNLSLYFNGVETVAQRNLLIQAGARMFYTDPVGLRLFIEPLVRSNVRLALDSGAVRKDFELLKEKRWLQYQLYHRLSPGALFDAEWYTNQVQIFRAMGFEFDFVSSAECVHEPRVTLDHWIMYGGPDSGMAPMWLYGTHEDDLLFYLDESEIVIIGDLAGHTRNRDERALTHLANLCTRYPGRFHLHSLEWIKAITTLAPLIRSFDTNKWRDGAKKGTQMVLFENNRLYGMPANEMRFIGERPDAEARTVMCCQALLDFEKSVVAALI